MVFIGAKNSYFKEKVQTENSNEKAKSYLFDHQMNYDQGLKKLENINLLDHCAQPNGLINTKK